MSTNESNNVANNNDDLYAPIDNAKIETTGLNIRIPVALKDEFTKHCESKGLSATEVLKRFMAREVNYKF